MKKSKNEVKRIDEEFDIYTIDSEVNKIDFSYNKENDALILNNDRYSNYLN